MAILTLFFCSGATALVYEVIWSKYMALLFGSTVQAQTVVLAVFMGGLALGNKLFSRSADRARNPLAIYGRIEIAIGIYALLFSFLYRIADSVFASIGSSLLDHYTMLLALKGIMAVILLLGPTILMGGTLPILAAWLQRTMPDAGRRSARFYSVNSFGAVCGAGLSGFWLVEWLGLRTTMNWSAVVNLIIGLTAIALGSVQSPHPHSTGQPATSGEKPSEESRRDNSTFLRACMMVTVTGAVSMGLEVLSSRCLCLIFGASLGVFSIVLMAFILGISIGSAFIASPSRKLLKSDTTAILLMLCAAVLIGFVVFNIENLVSVYLTAQTGLSRNLMGYRFYRVLIAMTSICVLGLPAAALGSVLPIWIRADSETAALLGDRVGRLLTWNTLGAVGGSLATGFALMPIFGLRGAFTALATVLVVVAIVTAMTARRPLVVFAGIAVGVFLIFATVNGGEGWRFVFSAGIFRLNNPKITMASFDARKKLVNLEFYEDAPDATVSVESAVNGNGDRSLRVDGKPEATGISDSSTQLLLAILPLMAKPDSKDVMCFGMGSGISAGTTLGFPIDHLIVAENCGPVLRAAKLFDLWNDGVLTNRRTGIYHEDARTVLKLSPRKYDTIMAEPSNPWMAGVASVFTREFYQLAASRLKPGGIMAQWFQTYEMDDQAVDVVLRTFHSVFPEMEIWDVAEGDVVMLGCDRPWKSDTDVYKKAFEYAKVRADLASIGIDSPDALLSRRLASQRTAFAIPTPGRMQGDDTPILEYAAPRAFYMHLQSPGVFRLQSFDERTWQMDLAADRAVSELATLDPPALKSIFVNGGSVNPDILSFLQNVYKHYVNGAELKPLMVNGRAMPCALAGTNRPVGIASPPSAQTNIITQQLVMSEYVLRAQPARQAEAVANIEGALNAVTNYNPRGADWSPAFYADMAVKACLRLNDPVRARAILLRGLQMEPYSDQLQYLSRILLREKILQPADVPQLASR